MPSGSNQTYQDSLAQQPAPDSQVFRFPRALFWFMVFGAVFCSAVAAFAGIQLRPETGGLFSSALFPAAIFLASAVLCLYFSLRLSNSVAVSCAGIWVIPFRGQPTFMAWNEIATLTDNDIQQRLVLRDSSGARTIRLDYQLENFPKLRALVLEHVYGAAQSHTPADGVFHHSRINKAILCFGTALFISLAGVTFVQGEKGPAGILLGCSLIPLIAFFRDPSLVAVRQDTLVIKYPGWSRNISFNSIISVTRVDVSQKGNVWAGVVIERDQAGAIKLFRIREGSIALEEAIRSALKASRGAAAAQTS